MAQRGKEGRKEQKKENTEKNACLKEALNRLVVCRLTTSLSFGLSASLPCTLGNSETPHRTHTGNAIARQHRISSVAYRSPYRLSYLCTQTARASCTIRESADKQHRHAAREPRRSDDDPDRWIFSGGGWTPVSAAALRRPNDEWRRREARASSMNK